MTDDYEVGYGKPPKAHQFKKGQSGNPKGRPKGAKNLDTLFLNDAQTKIAIKEGGETKIVSKLTAVIMCLSMRAMKGDAASMRQYIQLARDLLPAPEPASSNEEAFSADDLAVLRNYGSFLSKIEAIEASREDEDEEG